MSGYKKKKCFSCGKYGFVEPLGNEYHYLTNEERKNYGWIERHDLKSCCKKVVWVHMGERNNRQCYNHFIEKRDESICVFCGADKMFWIRVNDLFEKGLALSVVTVLPYGLGTLASPNSSLLWRLFIGGSCVTGIASLFIAPIIYSMWNMDVPPEEDSDESEQEKKD